MRALPREIEEVVAENDALGRRMDALLADLLEHRERIAARVVGQRT